MACRTPVADAVATIRRGAARVVEVSDDEIESAMRAIFDDTHNVAEGAGAAALAGLLKDGGTPGSGGFVLTGGNVDAAVFARVLAAD
jgi:threonine dehydratase